MLRAAALGRTPCCWPPPRKFTARAQKPAFGEDDDLLIGPPGQSRWSYACSKLTDEFLALAYAREKSLPVIIARLFNTVGPRQTGPVRHGAAAVHRRGEKGRAAEGFRRRRADALFLPCARRGGGAGAAEELPQALGEIFNVGGTGEISIRELARLIVKTLDSKSEVNSCRTPGPMRPCPKAPA